METSPDQAGSSSSRQGCLLKAQKWWQPWAGDTAGARSQSRMRNSPLGPSHDSKWAFSFWLKASIWHLKAENRPISHPSCIRPASRGRRAAPVPGNAARGPLWLRSDRRGEGELQDSRGCSESDAERVCKSAAVAARPTANLRQPDAIP